MVKFDTHRLRREGCLDRASGSYASCMKKLPLKPKPKSAEIAPLPVATKRRDDADLKWSPEVMKFGYTKVPNLLLDAQARLKITPVQMTVLIQVIEHWWNADERPFPAKELIARRLNKSPRQIQRYLTQLENKGLIARMERYRGKKQQTTNAFALDGLVKKLKAVVPEFTEAREQKRLKKRLLQKKVETAAQ